MNHTAALDRPSCTDDLYGTPVYIGLQAMFMVLYGSLAVMSFYALGRSFMAFRSKVLPPGSPAFLASNKNQVVLALGIGCFVRVLAFIDVGCVYEAIFRSLKDMFFVMSFVLVVLFWVELQKFVRQMTSVQALRPYLYGIMACFLLFRGLACIADLLWSSLVKNIFNGVLVVLYASIMFIGLWYGSSLLRKMQSMKRSDMKARLQKLTWFIILENFVLVVFLLEYLTRTLAFASDKANNPVRWYYLKISEKSLEFLCILVLCLTMTGKSDDAKKDAKPPGRANSSSVSVDKTSSSSNVTGKAGTSAAAAAAANGGGKKPDGKAKRGSGSSSGGVTMSNLSSSSTTSSSTLARSVSNSGKGDRAALLAEAREAMDESFWVKAPIPGTSKVYYFCPATQERKWHLPPDTRILTMAEYRSVISNQQSSDLTRDQKGGEGTLQAVNPLNVEVKIPPPPAEEDSPA